jgi:hypothetical protein
METTEPGMQVFCKDTPREKPKESAFANCPNDNNTINTPSKRDCMQLLLILENCLVLGTERPEQGIQSLECNYLAMCSP